MSLLSRLFGGGAPKPGPEPVLHEGFAIFPDPEREGSRYRIRATIEKEVGGVKKSHTMIRADVLEDRDAAVEATLAKAKLLIDQQGERLFD